MKNDWKKEHQSIFFFFFLIFKVLSAHDSFASISQNKNQTKRQQL